MKENQKKITIIGAGFTGLSVAYYLLKKSYKVEIFESAPFVGGQASTINLSGFEIERGYHHLFTGDKYIIQLIDDLGIRKSLKWHESSVGIFDGNKLFSFQSAIDLIKFNKISFYDRIKLGFITLYLKYKKNWKSLEPYTASEWIKNKVGKNVYYQIWGPLLKGKFGDYSEEIGMPWFWGKIQTRFASRKRLNKEVLGYPDGSFKIIIDSLITEIQQNGGRIYKNTPVKKINYNKNENLEIEFLENNLNNKLKKTDVILSTVPSFEMIKICQFPKEYRFKLQSSKYLGASVFILELKYKLSPFYWLNIADNNSPFLGVIEQSNLLSSNYYRGKHFIYLTNYLDRNDWRYKLDESELLNHYCDYLKKINSQFNDDWILNYRYNKISAAQPIIGKNYGEIVPEITTPLKGVFLANTTQIYPEDRGTNYSVKMAKKVVSLIDKHFLEDL
jgi:protoporphyrinogen oxidase